MRETGRFHSGFMVVSVDRTCILYHMYVWGYGVVASRFCRYMLVGHLMWRGGRVIPIVMAESDIDEEDGADVGAVAVRALMV